MEEKNKKSQVLKISVFVASIILILISVSYAFITQTFAGTKKQVITAGVLDLVLDEKSEITISDALPMYDNVGMMQEEVYEFDLINNTTTDTEYTIKLNKVNTSDLSENIVKYGLIKDGQQKIAFLSTLNDGVIDSGTISGSDTIEYELRLWIDSNVTDENSISGKTLSYTLSVEVGQAPEPQATERILLTYNANTPILETKTATFTDAGQTYSYDVYKISDTVFEKNELIGKYMVGIVNGEEQRMILTDSDLISSDEEGGFSVARKVIFVKNNLQFFDQTLTPGVWVVSTILSEFNATEIRLVETIENTDEGEIIFEWNKGDQILGTYESAMGNYYRYSDIPLARVSAYEGYKLIVENADGTVTESTLSVEDESLVETEDGGDSIAFPTLLSIYSETGGEIPLGIYLHENVEKENNVVRIAIMKP